MSQQHQDIFKKLSQHYKPPKSFLNYEEDFQFVVAVILSAQCTDKIVNQITPKLFQKFGSIKEFALSNIEELQKYLSAINYFRTKATYIQKTAQLILEKFGGKIPCKKKDLISLPGIGPKSANAILSQLFQIPTIVVDTHVIRLSNRMGFTKEKDPRKIEKDLSILWPKETWIAFSKLLIIHGRTICQARNPKCTQCPIKEICPKIERKK